jgi:hypothetical protein
MNPDQLDQADARMARLTLNLQNVLGLSAGSDLLVTVTVSALVDAYGPERAGASRPTRGRHR